MRDVTEYEILLLLDPEAPEERHDEIIARTRELVERDGGRWDSHQPWGRRKLAYEIGHKGEGTYHLLGFTVAPDTLSEVSRILRITDGVMRHLATRRLKGSGRTPPPPPTPFEAPPVPEPEPHAEPVAATAPTDAGAEPEPTATPSDSAEGA